MSTTFSKLDAVNRVLRSIGESTVSQLNSGLPDAEEAEQTLDEISLEVQSQGWYCNTDEDYELTPTIDLRIKLAESIHRVDTVGRSAAKPVVMKVDVDELTYLWDVDKETFDFTSSIRADIVRILDFKNLPYEMKAYIAARAAKVYQEREMGSVSLDSFTSRREMDTWAALLDREAEVSDRNILTDSRIIAAMTYRNNDLR